MSIKEQKLILSGPVNAPEAKNIPEAIVWSTTWVRESHGLYDFEGTEIERKQFKIKGSHRFYRAESEVNIEHVESERFEPSEKMLEEKQKEKIIGRLLQ